MFNLNDVVRITCPRMTREGKMFPANTIGTIVEHQLVDADIHYYVVNLYGHVVVAREDMLVCA